MAIEIKEFVGNGNIKTINETTVGKKKPANKKTNKKGGKTSK